MKYRDSTQAKQVVPLFDQIYKKHSKKMSVSAMSSTMFADHMLPMVQITDKKNGEVVAQIFNFIDQIDDPQNLTANNIEKFLIARGILQSDAKKDSKDSETYRLANQSSFINQKTHDDLDIITEKLNIDLIENTEQKVHVVYDPNTIKYKDEMLKAYRMMIDPFNVEIGEGTFDYEQNPAEPTKPTKTITITKYEPKQD